MTGDRGKWHEIGQTGLRVPPIAFGTSGIGNMPETYGYEVDEERALATVRAILDVPDGFQGGAFRPTFNTERACRDR